jgi:hypothetical protein
MEKEIRTTQTYRIEHNGKFSLFEVIAIGKDKVKIRDLSAGTTHEVSRSSFQRRLDEGKIYVSSYYHQRGTG